MALAPLFSLALQMQNISSVKDSFESRCSRLASLHLTLEKERIKVLTIRLEQRDQIVPKKKVLHFGLNSKSIVCPYIKGIYIYCAQFKYDY